MMTVIREDKQQIAVLIMSNRPVNALSRHVREGLIAQLQAAEADPQVKAVVITAEGRMFSGGADITEFGFDLNPLLPEVLRQIEECTKPVVAALNGAAYGGGLELALACHYRISQPDALIGLPEVNLGLLPGAGGTQRLPRLAGVPVALQMIVTGQPQRIEQVPGVIDRISSSADSLRQAAVAYALELASTNAPLKLAAQRSATSDVPDGIFGQFRQQIAKTARGYKAPWACIEAVEAATSMPFEEGLQRERELFMECLNSPQSRAQRHLFLSERKAGQVPGVSRETPTRDIASVAIIGAGTMGGGIAMNFANAGIPVTLLEQKPEALEAGLAVIRRNYQASAAKGKLSPDQVEQRMELLHGTLSYEDLSDADLVIEAVFEKMAVKQAVFRELDRVCKPGAILASNTSTLDLNEIAAITARPGDVIGLHFFSPANVMKLLEVVRGKDTSADVIATCMQLARTIRKVPVVVGVCFGFVGNRMLEPYGREANRLLLEGSTPAKVDRVLMDFGFPMGPFTMGDMAGLDIGYFVRESRQEHINRDPGYCVVADRLVEAGRVGLKAGAGVYRYQQGDRRPQEDPETHAIALAEAKRLGVRQRDHDGQEILERCLFPLINEGAHILEEGMANRPGDIDVIYVYGYGFPPFRGGPMQYADEIGLKVVYDALCRYRDALGDYGKLWFQPAPLLERLVREGKQFSGLNT